jgi:hypothetical protein
VRNIDEYRDRNLERLPIHDEAAEVSTNSPPPELHPVPAGEPRIVPADSRLMDQNERRDLQDRWNAAQTGFVDDPLKAVKDADQLIEEAMKRLTDSFARERSKLEQGEGARDGTSTEDLRLALQRYRDIFKRLVAI